MGLIVETPITIHTQTRVCTDGSSSSNYEDTGSFDMTLYRVLSMQDDMKTLVYPVTLRNEFDLFLEYAEAKTLGAVNSNFDSLDAYLGTVGITTTMCKG